MVAMLIGGQDITFQYSIKEPMAAATRAVLSVWPRGFVEPSLVPEPRPTEAFIFKSREASDAWNRLGWNAEYCRDLVCLFLHDDTLEVTCVVEDIADPELCKILNAITFALIPDV